MDTGGTKDEKKKKSSPMSPCENLYRRFDGEGQRRLETLLAMAIGLPWYQAMTAQRKRGSKKSKLPKPSKDQLVKEGKRRHELLGLSETNELKPTTAWGCKQLRAWLEKHPIRDKSCILFLRQEIETIIQGLETNKPSFGGAVSSREGMRTDDFSPELVQGDEPVEQKAQSEPCPGLGSGIPVPSTTLHVAAAGEGECPDRPKNKLHPKVLMARILGLPNSDFGIDPLKQQWCAPTDEMLLAECKRRVTMFGSPRRAVMIKWLTDNPIQDSQECACLLMQLLDLDLETDMATMQSVTQLSEQAGHQQSIPDSSKPAAMLGDSQARVPFREDDVGIFFNDLLYSCPEDVSCTAKESAKTASEQQDQHTSISTDQRTKSKNAHLQPPDSLPYKAKENGIGGDEDTALAHSSWEADVVRVDVECNRGSDRKTTHATEARHRQNSGKGTSSTSHLLHEEEGTTFLTNRSAVSSWKEEDLKEKVSADSVDSPSTAPVNNSTSRQPCPAGANLVTVFEIGEPSEKESSRSEVDSIDVSSASDSMMKMSLSSFGGSNSNPSSSSSSGGSSKAMTSLLSYNPSISSSLSSGQQIKADSSNNSKTQSSSGNLNSSQGNSGLTADTQQQLRLRGAGLSTVEEDALEMPGSIAGLEFDVAVNNLAGPHQKTDGPEDDDTLTLPSAAIAGSVPIDGTGISSVKDRELCDKEGRRGTYSGTCSGSLFVPLVPNGKGKMEYANGIVYNGDWQDGEWHGHGRVTFAENDYYAGALAKGFFWGHGVRHWADGSNYEGDWMLDKRSGTGTLNDCNGVWEGKWVDDKLNGFGRRTFPDGSQYDGMFVRGSQQGPCKYRDCHGGENEGIWVSNHALPDGSRYSGLWKDEKPHGYGTCRYANGDVYEGEYRHGVKQGYGRFVYSDGSQYEGLFVDSADLGDWKSENGKKDEVVWVSNHNLPDGASYDGPCQDGHANGFGKSRYQNGDVYEGQHSDDVKHGKGRFSFADGSEYVGFFVEGLEQGECTYKDIHGREYNGLWVSKQEMSEGSSYDGLWKDGAANGFGRCRYQNGDRYEGCFVDGKFDGLGKFVWSDGREYNGEWTNGKRNGEGRSRYNDGETYFGSYVNNKKEGLGKYTYADGKEYEGEWFDDKPNGKGKSRFPNGDRYEGQYVDGHEAGFGKFIYATGGSYTLSKQHVYKATMANPYGHTGIYTGQVHNDKPQEKGTMNYEDGRVYVGEWHEGRWHGQARVTFSNGDSFDGQFRYDQCHGKGTYRWHDGRIYSGGFNADKPQGFGTFTWPDGARYEGEFRDGQREGRGTYKFADGGVYTGEWRQGHHHGQGICTWSDGRIHKGEWHMAKLTDKTERHTRTE